MAGLGLVGIWSLVGCSPSPPTKAWEERDPSYVIEAIVETRQEEDTTRLRELVDQLDSDDPVVRLLAINTLEDFTGQTLGYDYRAPRPDRRVAIARWVEAIEQGDVTVIETDPAG